MACTCMRIKNNDEMQKVGNWELSPDSTHENQRFHNPKKNGGCGSRAVTHKDASVKPLTNIFSFKAPKAGAGTIKFRVLIKRGETNTGEFYWPEATLELTEKQITNHRRTEWKLTSITHDTCDKVCKAAKGTCNANRMQKSIKNTGNSNFNSARKSITCSRPYLSMGGTDCKHHGILNDGNGHCFYRDDESKCSSPVAADLCTRKASKFNQMCACDLPSSNFCGLGEINPPNGGGSGSNSGSGSGTGSGSGSTSGSGSGSGSGSSSSSGSGSGSGSGSTSGSGSGAGSGSGSGSTSGSGSGSGSGSSSSSGSGSGSGSGSTSGSGSGSDQVQVQVLGVDLDQDQGQLLGVDLDQDQVQVQVLGVDLDQVQVQVLGVDLIRIRVNYWEWI